MSLFGHQDLKYLIGNKEADLVQRRLEVIRVTLYFLAHTYCN